MGQAGRSRRVSRCLTLAKAVPLSLHGRTMMSLTGRVGGCCLLVVCCRRIEHALDNPIRIDS